MTNILHTLVISSAFTMMAHSTLAHTIEVKVNGIDTSRKGQIMVMLFGKDGFPINHEKALKTIYLAPNQATHNVRLSVPISEFAIKVLHDEDNSRKTTKNWTGIVPAEGLGFSNGVTISWRGAPKFKDAKLTLSGLSNPVQITLRYP
ncbi:DUF2141 domain-containing protein [Pseudoalteromonas luteoviolacea]|nr:DUF2141 domain-containing protein [Pseudoalteromonas luteoviolacea]